MNDEPKLNQKTVIVTGAAQGIGLGITRELLKADCSVAGWDIDDEALSALAQENADDKRLLLQKVDVACEQQVQAAVAIVMEQFGELHGVVNNAGIANPESGPVQELELAKWQKWIDVDLTAPFLLAKHTSRHLAQVGGAIVNIASTRALQSEPDCEAYAAAKGGLVALTHALAVSLAGQVRVNAISPGWIAVEDFKKPSAARQPQLSALDHRQHPAGRVGRPQDIASLCRYLLTDEAGFITGENIVVDGGMTRKMIYC